MKTNSPDALREIEDDLLALFVAAIESRLFLENRSRRNTAIRWAIDAINQSIVAAELNESFAEPCGVFFSMTTRGTLLQSPRELTDLLEEKKK